MQELREKKCEPCESGTQPMNENQVAKYMELLTPEWKVIENKKIKKSFPFENFKRGMAFAQDVALIAEKEQHHPDICIHYTNVEIELTTHNIGGLSENDFIMAAKIEEL
ncbi:MAG TPA: 4a-hydroxytetrahydrobiopterin dehydratase [Bacteroidales bacterium]|nr:4a-hydroxytetrahydrobiopterin dehydratase [Bacteroidales bacterium]